jgi:putative endonuclease
MPNNTEKGNLGEEIAISYLLKHGYEILDKNWRFKHLEVDIIARINGVLVIVEVKLRASNAFGAPEEFVTKAKQKKVIKAAHYYIIENNIQSETRFDIISIIQNANQLEVEHIPAAFYPGL